MPLIVLKFEEDISFDWRNFRFASHQMNFSYDTNILIISNRSTKYFKDDGKQTYYRLFHVQKHILLQ